MSKGLAITLFFFFSFTNTYNCLGVLLCNLHNTRPQSWSSWAPSPSSQQSIYVSHGWPSQHVFADSLLIRPGHTSLLRRYSVLVLYGKLFTVCRLVLWGSGTWGRKVDQQQLRGEGSREGPWWKGPRTRSDTPGAMSPGTVSSSGVIWGQRAGHGHLGLGMKETVPVEDSAVQGQGQPLGLHPGEGWVDCAA